MNDLQRQNSIELVVSRSGNRDKEALDTMEIQRNFLTDGNR